MFDGQYLPTDFDVLLNDVHARDLHHDISRQLGRIYLADYTDNSPVDDIVGIIWGPHKRVFVPMGLFAREKTRMGKKHKNVHMLIDTGSPSTYVSNEVFSSFDKMIYNPNNHVTVNINGRPIAVLQSPEQSHFSEMNILGSDYLKICNAKVNLDYATNVVQINLLNV